MRTVRSRAALWTACAWMGVLSVSVHAQAQGTHEGTWNRSVGGWSVTGMAQAFPIVSASKGGDVEEWSAYLTQPAIMMNVMSPGARIVLHATLNFEGLTQRDGEQTFGGWGEGFLDRRHPHTLVHELMLSVNFPAIAGGALSVSAGKGFAPYGTEDPMSRPVVKYPTNHHLSQILERWVAGVAYVRGGWSVEAGVFGGAEPEGPYDFSNIRSFPDSWSARVTRRFADAGLEAGASYGRVREEHGDEVMITDLYNAALRYDRGNLYGLVEASLSDPRDGDGYFSILGETRLLRGRHAPYLRVEYATRPEYAREGVVGTDGFFRYDHDAHPIGATRWLITSAGYGFTATRGAVSLRPFVEVQHHRVTAHRGGIDPAGLFGTATIWGASAGVRVFLGGGPMRMGSYGVLDPMITHDVTPEHHINGAHAEHD